MGGTKCRPLVLWGGIRTYRRANARLPARQDEVRAEHLFGSNLFSKKVAIPCGFLKRRSDFYPFSHRFEPTILLLFKVSHFLFQRLLFRKEFSFFGSVNITVYVLLQIPIKKSLELGVNDFDSLLICLNKSRNG